MARKQITFRPTKEVEKILAVMGPATGKSINDLLCEAVMFYFNGPENTDRAIKSAASDLVDAQTGILLDGVRQIIREEMDGSVQNDVKKNSQVLNTRNNDERTE
jgi:hypothetical protein